MTTPSLSRGTDEQTLVCDCGHPRSDHGADLTDCHHGECMCPFFWHHEPIKKGPKAEPSPMVTIHMTRRQAEILERAVEPIRGHPLDRALVSVREALSHNANGKTYRWDVHA